MTLTFDQKPEDLYVLSLYVGWDAPERRQFRRISNTLPILALIGLAAWMFGNDVANPMLIVVVVGLALASLFLMPRLVRWMQVRRIDNMIKRHPHPELLIGPREVAFEEEKIRMTVGEKSSEFLWEGVQRWVKLEDHYLVFVRANVALVIPQSAMTGSEEQNLEALLSEKMSPTTDAA
jgi:hypothetical protein